MSSIEDPISRLTKREKGELPGYEEMSCSEYLDFLGKIWDESPEWSRSYFTGLLVYKECYDGLPYLLEQIESPSAESRKGALNALSRLGFREHRGVFIRLLLQDEDAGVKRRALIDLSALFLDGSCFLF